VRDSYHITSVARLLASFAGRGILAAPLSKALCFYDWKFHMNQLFKTSISRSSLTVVTMTFMPFVLGGCSPKDLPLPEHEQGLKTVSGQIVTCDIEELGSSGRTIFVGMAVDAPGEPYIRFNYPRDERLKYETWCDQNSVVTITYKAKSTERRPEITYWAESIEENET